MPSTLGLTHPGAEAPRQSTLSQTPNLTSGDAEMTTLTECTASPHNTTAVTGGLTTPMPAPSHPQQLKDEAGTPALPPSPASSGEQPSQLTTSPTSPGRLTSPLPTPRGLTTPLTSKTGRSSSPPHQKIPPPSSHTSTLPSATKSDRPSPESPSGTPGRSSLGATGGSHAATPPASTSADGPTSLPGPKPTRKSIPRRKDSSPALALVYSAWLAGNLATTQGGGGTAATPYCLPDQHGGGETPLSQGQAPHRLNSTQDYYPTASPAPTGSKEEPWFYILPLLMLATGGATCWVLPALEHGHTVRAWLGPLLCLSATTIHWLLGIRGVTLPLTMLAAYPPIERSVSRLVQRMRQQRRGLVNPHRQHTLSPSLRHWSCLGELLLLVMYATLWWVGYLHAILALVEGGRLLLPHVLRAVEGLCDTRGRSYTARPAPVKEPRSQRLRVHDHLQEAQLDPTRRYLTPSRPSRQHELRQPRAPVKPPPAVRAPTADLLYRHSQPGGQGGLPRQQPRPGPTSQTGCPGAGDHLLTDHTHLQPFPRL